MVWTVLKHKICIFLSAAFMIFFYCLVAVESLFRRNIKSVTIFGYFYYVCNRTVIFVVY
ncbi:hypothetical protein CI610_00528 [invertebrate metagenome]|uniref:Uncharacterized protein n=1 Tax=invertebrate metagenome TaxID=1711999 RepID=A0A2H9TB78_9ZZZZ